MSYQIPQEILSKLPTQLSELFSGVRFIYNTHPRGVLAASVTAVIIPWAIHNFRQYKALGKNGFPSYFVGWVIATLLKPLGRRDTTSTDEYSRDLDKSTWLVSGSGSHEIPCRPGPRPRTGWHFAPHRQAENYTDKQTASMLVQEFRDITQANLNLVAVQVSPHERIGDAMLIHPSIPSPHKVADEAWREIAHYHGHKVYSMHVTLSPQDCKLVIEQGWGERHPLSGRLSLPKENLLIYGPREEDDVRVAGLIVRASIGYMTGHKDVK